MNRIPTSVEIDYVEATRFSKDYVDLPGNLKNDAIKKICSSFVRNMSRVHSIGFLPVYLSYAANDFGQVYTAACVNLGGDEDAPAIDREMRRLRDAAKITRSKDERMRIIESVGGGQIDAAINTGSLNILHGVDATLAAMMIGSWTAFESLAGDMWVEVVNQRPSKLAQMVIKAQNSRIDSETGADAADLQQAKTIPLINLQKYGYDLRDKMGTLLRDMKKVNFDNLRDIKLAYKTAFPNQAEKIFSKYTSMPITEAIRNLYAHKGGVIDARFLKRVAKESAFSGFEQGDPIALTGTLVRSHIDAVARCSIDLAGFVDDWLAGNPP
jgi:hypothetical protein